MEKYEKEKLKLLIIFTPEEEILILLHFFSLMCAKILKFFNLKYAYCIICHVKHINYIIKCTSILNLIQLYRWIS